ncbi:hypothetical protein E4U46_000206 [Claviceps purpurea]|nr:hypothetical protein E4U46_000206 [Claviceps purpurea]
MIECHSGYVYYSCQGGKFEGCADQNPCWLYDLPHVSLPEQPETDSTIAEWTDASVTDWADWTVTDSTTSSTAWILTSTMESPEASSTSSSSYTSSSSSSSSSSPHAPAPSPSPAGKTDSGVAHPISNSAIVTVTRHTVVFSEAPRSTGSPSSVTGITKSEEAATSPALCSTCTPKSTFTSSPSSNESERGTLSAGAIAGSVTGAAIMVIVISLIMVFVLRRRKKSRASCDASEAVTLSSDSGATGSEKSNPTKDGFSRMSSDPFAPFGGRVDKSSYRPSTGTFELDGVAITAVELPATSIPEVPDTVKTAATAPDEASESDTVKTAAAAPDEASEPDTVKTAAAAPDEASESDTVKTAAAAPDEASEPDTVKTAAAAPDEASESDIVKTAATAPDEASESDIVKTATAAPDEASEPSTAPPTPEPAATLASPSSPQGKTTYVNQWNEYKALEAGEASG